MGVFWHFLWIGLHYWYIAQSNFKWVERISEEYFLMEGDISKVHLTTESGMILPSIFCPNFFLPPFLADLWADVSPPFPSQTSFTFGYLFFFFCLFVSESHLIFASYKSSSVIIMHQSCSRSSRLFGRESSLISFGKCSFDTCFSMHYPNSLPIGKSNDLVTPWAFSSFWKISDYTDKGWKASDAVHSNTLNWAKGEPIIHS